MRIDGHINVTSDVSLGLGVSDIVTLHHILHVVSVTQGMPLEWSQFASETMQLLENVGHTWIAASRPPVDPAYSGAVLNHDKLVREALRAYQKEEEEAASKQRMAEFDRRWQCHACGKDGEYFHTYCGWCGEHRKFEFEGIDHVTEPKDL